MPVLDIQPLDVQPLKGKPALDPQPLDLQPLEAAAMPAMQPVAAHGAPEPMLPGPLGIMARRGQSYNPPAEAAPQAPVFRAGKPAPALPTRTRPLLSEAAAQVQDFLTTLPDAAVSLGEGLAASLPFAPAIPEMIAADVIGKVPALQAPGKAAMQQNAAAAEPVLPTDPPEVAAMKTRLAEYKAAEAATPEPGVLESLSGVNPQEVEALWQEGRYGAALGKVVPALALATQMARGGVRHVRERLRPEAPQPTPELARTPEMPAEEPLPVPPQPAPVVEQPAAVPAPRPLAVEPLEMPAEAAVPVESKPMPPRKRAGEISAQPTATPAGAIERYQWMANREGGQQAGNRQTIAPLTEDLFNRFVREKVEVQNFAEYHKKFPKVTHINLTERADGTTVLGSPAVGSLAELRPKGEAVTKGWAKKVESFETPEAAAQAEIADSDILPAPARGAEQPPEKPPTMPQEAPVAPAPTPAVTPQAEVPAAGGRPQPSPPPAEAAKEPWEMSKSDYYEAARAGRVPQEAERAEALRNAETNQQGAVEERKRFDTITNRHHEAAVTIAFAQGKPVPPEVLKDYAELQGKAPSPPAPKSTQQSASELAEAKQKLAEIEGKAAAPAPEIALREAAENGRQAARASRSGDAETARSIREQQSKRVSVAPAAERKALTDAFNQAYREIANAPVQPKEPSATVVPALKAGAKATKPKPITLREVKELEREYGITAQRSTAPEVDLAVSRARRRWQEAKAQWEAQQTAKRPVTEPQPHKFSKKVGAQPTVTSTDDAIALMRKLQTFTWDRAKIIDQMTPEQAKGILRVKPEDRPVGLNDQEIQQLKDKAGIIPPTLEARAKTQIALGKAQQLEPAAAVAEKGRNFEGRYVQAALEPVRDAWIKNLKSQDTPEENWKWMVKTFGKGGKPPAEFPKEMLFIKVPDDGSFFIPNTPFAIDNALKGAGRFAPTHTGVPKPGRWRTPEVTEADRQRYIERLEHEIKEGETALQEKSAADEWQKDVANLKAKGERSEKENEELGDLERQTWHEQNLAIDRQETEERIRVAKETIAELKAEAKQAPAAPAEVAPAEAEPAPPPAASVVPALRTGKPPEGVKVAARLRSVADNLEKQIEDRKRPMTQNPTPKRMKEYRQRLHDAENMERTQRALRALADAHEAGTVPPELANLRTKDEIGNLVYKGLTGGGGYYDVIPSREYGNKTPAGKRLQEMIEKQAGETSEVKAEKERLSKISQMEAETQFSNIPGSFPTPKPLAERLVNMADIRLGMKVLEPSAGKGNIADAIQAKGVSPDTIEINSRLADILKLKNYNVVGSDFLDHKAGGYDRIVMNPPFEKGADAEHVQHAYDLLKPGGRLVAVMGEGSFFRGDKKATAFREWLEERGGSSEKVANGFTGPGAERQTGVASRIVVIDKPAKARAAEAGGGGTVGFRGPRPTLATQAQLTQNPELIRKSDILKQLSAKLNDIPIRTGRFRDRALGIFKVIPEVVRTKRALDLPVASHEIGHYVNKLLWGVRGKNLNWKPLAAFRQELEPIATQPKAGQSKLPEGFAEFVRLYLTDPAQAQAKAPKFSAFFERELAREPEVRDALLGAQQQIARYIAQPAVAKVLAHISQTETREPLLSWNRFYTATVDRMRPIKAMVKELGQGKPPLPTEQDAGQLAQLTSGWIGKAETFLERGTFDPSKRDLPLTGKPLKEILQPFEDRLDDLRAYLIARRAVEKAGQGLDTGIELSDAKQTIKDLESPELEQAAKELYAYNDALLEYSKDAGMLSEEGLKAIRAMNENYVPFYRVMEERAGMPFAGAGGGKRSFADLWSPVKRMKGSGREIIDPLESIIKNTYTVINTAERNKVSRAIVRQAKNTPGAAKWVEEIPGPMQPTKFELADIRQQLQKAGFDISEGDLETIATVFTPSSRAPQGDNIITVLDGGKRKFYQVHPELYRAIKGLDEETLPLVFRLLSMPAQLLRVGATSLSPSFAIRNPLRDAGDAFMQSDNGFLPGVDTARGLFHAVKKDDLYWEWKRAGGEHSMMVSMDRRHLRDNLRELLRQPLGNVARHPLEALKMLSEFTEEASRVGEYARARKKGATPAEAALASREVTLDFARMGARTKAMNAITAFWNAGVQGTDKFVRTHWNHPYRTVFRGVVGLTVPSLLLYAINRDDPRYQELPRWQKDFFFIIPTFNDKVPFIRLPKPFLYGMVYSSLPERTMEWIDKRSPEAFDDLLTDVISVGSPGFVPTAAIPALEAWADRSLFTGRPLTPGYLKNLPAKYQAQPYTSQTAKDIALGANRLGIPVSPIVVDNTIFGYTGGAGRAATGALDLGLRALHGVQAAPARHTADNPVVSAFVARWPDSNAESIRKVYDRLAQLKEKDAAAKFEGRFPGRAPGAAYLTGAEQSELRDLNNASRELSRLHVESREIGSLSKMTPEAKRQRLDRIQTEMVNVARQALGKSAIAAAR